MEIMSLEEHSNRVAKAKKIMILFASISMFMMFAGLTSAYIVSASRPDWLKEFSLPSAFTASTVIIFLSSVTAHLAKSAVKKDKRKIASILLMTTLCLGCIFIGAQLYGFNEIIADGYFFTGPESTVTTSFLYVITMSHLAHIFAGIIVLLVLNFNHLKGKYQPAKLLGMELGIMFWHFVDMVWIFLFLFFTYY